MNLTFRTVAMALVFVGSVPAFAQSAVITDSVRFPFESNRANISTPASQPFSMSLSGSADKGTWHTVMIISAVVGIIGLVDGDSTLTLIGAGGVLLSLFETGGSSSFRFQGFRHGFDLVHSGPLSFGVNPFGALGPIQNPSISRPNPFVQLSIKF